MKTRATLITLLFFLSSATALRAQTLLDQSLVPQPYSPLKTLTNYQPSVIASEQDALTLYQAMPTSIFKPNSLCSQRAEKWTYDFFGQYQLKSMKVLLLFTRRYQREFAYQWDYHIAPLIPVQMNDGTIQELVFDPTFTRAGVNHNPVTVDNQAISIQAWTRYFVYPAVDCLQIDNYAEYENYQERAYCYVMKVPMYNYIPDNLLYASDAKKFADDKHWYDPTTQMRTNFRPHDLKDMKQGLK